MPHPIPLLTEEVDVASSEIRAGYLPEQGSFKGNILYFEGLGDSMLNHSPLFTKLSRAGYRVIAFDYMGQGGSTGKMNNTRIKFIPTLGKTVWKRFARNTKLFPKKTIIGWSTGGLAAYMSALKNEAHQVILIAPGIAPHVNVGSGIFHWIPNEITMESLTSAAPYAKKNQDPHFEEIKPNSPVKVPAFSIDLLTTARVARKSMMGPEVRGLVLLSGQEDTYVNAEKTKQVLKKNAPGFEIIQYPGALHEIDNERLEIRIRAHNDILEFLQN